MADTDDGKRLLTSTNDDELKDQEIVLSVSSEINRSTETK